MGTESAKIRNLASRVGLQEAVIVRICALVVANTPMLEYIFDDHALRKAISLSSLRYSPTLRSIDGAMKKLEQQGIQIDASELICKAMNWRIKKIKS